MIELRLGLRARATRNLDAVFSAQFDAWLDQLDDAISQPVGGFALARTEPEEIKQTGTQRLQLIIDYRGRRWAQIPLEVAPVEAPDVLEIEHAEPLRVSQLGVPEPESVPVVAPGYQIAQKLHACTERFVTGPDNDRFRDLMDLLLLRGMLTEADLPLVRPTVTVYESWREPYRAMVRETHFEVQTVEDAAALVEEMIAEIDAIAGR